MFSRKDWVIFDLVNGNILHLSIVRHSDAKGRKSRKRNSTWYLTGYSCYFGLKPSDMGESLGKNYNIMLEASSSIDDYSYTVTPHGLRKENLVKSNYWKGTLKKKKLYNINMQGIHIPVNKKRFEDEIYRLVSH